MLGDFNPQYCASRSTLIILSLLALFTQLIGLSICCVCYRNRKFNSSDHQFYLNQITNRHRKQFRPTSLQTSPSRQSGLPNQMSNYFNRVD